MKKYRNTAVVFAPFWRGLRVNGGWRETNFWDVCKTQHFSFSPNIRAKHLGLDSKYRNTEIQQLSLRPSSLVNNKKLYPELKLFYTSTACDKYHVCHIIIFYSNFNHNSPLAALQCKLHDGRLQWNDHSPTLDQVFCTPLHQIDLIFIFPSLRFSPHLNVNPNLKLKCI